MRNTIVSLALLKVNWDHLKKDYLENFLPFIATLCVRKDYNIIDVEKICADFKEEYGLIVPYHPMISILNRSRKRGLFKKDHHKLYPLKDKIEELDFTEASKEQARQNEKVINEFIRYGRQNYATELSQQDAESALLVMLQQRDLDILFAADEGKLFSDLESKKGHQFILNKFIQYINQSEPELFSFVLNMAVGHILANAILYADFTKFEGKLETVKFYFDTRFILRVLGTEGKEREYHYVEFLKHLSEEKAILTIFRHTYDEIMTVLNTCLKWVENPAYDPTKASITCNYFVQNNCKESDVERFIIKIDEVLKKCKIEVVEAPDPNEYKIFQIDERELELFIVETYKDKYPLFDELVAKETLLRDIKSISSVYRLRRGRRPHSFSKVNSMFVTTNSSLAYASHKFQCAQGNGGFVYPACITDIFLGTLVWLQSPARVVSINKRKMIADCYAAVQPSKVLMKKYRQEIDKLRNENKINEDEYYLLRAHRTALNLLEEKTLGDPDNFTDKTPEEILEVIRQECQAEPIKKYLEIKDTLEKTEKDRDLIRDKIELLEHRIDEGAMGMAKIAGWCIFILLVILFTSGVLIQFFGTVNLLTPFLKVILLTITCIIGIMNVVTGFNFKGFRDRMVKWIAYKLVSYLK
jgi:hypothetical protein